MVFFCMAPRPPASPRTYAPVPHPTLFRSGASVDLAAAWSAVPDDVERLARRVPQHVVSAVAVEVADHRVEALAVDNHRHGGDGRTAVPDAVRSEEHTSELQSLMRISYAVFCLKKKKN